MLWLPLLMVLTGVFGFGISLLLAVLNVYIRDVSRLLPHLLRLWLYLSPAIWAYTMVLGDDPYEAIARINPMFSGMTAWTIALGGPLVDGDPTMVGSLLTFAGWAAVALVVGFLTFVSREDEFAVRN
jgi:teichoic acid transport system permease protein